MKAIAVTPMQANSSRLVDHPEPALHDHGVLVEVLQVGLCGTDAEINQGLYGQAPPGSDYLIIGHENFGRVKAVGAMVGSINPGEYVVATVRRPDDCANCRAGENDMCLKGNYRERGIKGLHGYMTEQYLETADYLVVVPEGLRHVGVLMEPLSIVEKGVYQAQRLQQRMAAWEPRTAVVLGAGPVGLLATLVLRNLGLNTYTVARTPRAEADAADLVAETGAEYISTKETPLMSLPERLGRIDIIFEATGFGPLAFDAMQILGINGVLILSSVTGGDRKAEVPVDKINLEMVLGNKVVVGTVNANRKYFEMGVRDMARFEAQWPGVMGRFITRRIDGLGGFPDGLKTLGQGIKTVIDVAAQ